MVKIYIKATILNNYITTIVEKIVGTFMIHVSIEEIRPIPVKRVTKTVEKLLILFEILKNDKKAL